jgi:hypothetical protein
MTIEVERVNGGFRFLRKYRLRVTPPHADPPWASDRPMSRRKAETYLYDFGNHTADIAEAFAAADDAWDRTARARGSAR